MTGQVTVPLPARRKGWHARAVGPDVASGAPGAAPAPTPDRIPRVARVLALAHHWRGLIRSGAVRNQAALARLVGVSRARVTQVMDLLYLAPAIQEALLGLENPGRVTAPLPHRVLLLVAQHPGWMEQKDLLAQFTSRGDHNSPRRER